MLLNLAVLREETKLEKKQIRVDKSRSRKEGGNGLGLTLCQVIANKHDAKLNIESELNQGTKVSIVF